MRIRVLGKQWVLKFVRMQGETVGTCDPPDKQGKEIRVSKSLRGQERLRVVLHELLHACHWHIDEEFIDKASRDFATVLYKLGYRMDGDKD